MPPSSTPSPDSPGAEPKRTGSESNRNAFVDIAKIMACIGVINIHIDPKSASAQNLAELFSISCVPFFYYISFSFFVKNIDKEDSLWNNVKKMFPAYFLWNLIYIFIRIYKQEVIHMASHPLNITHAVFFGSSSEHLYFVPVLIFIQSLAFGCYHLFRPSDKLKPITKVFFVGALIATGIVAQVQHVWGWDLIFVQFAKVVLAGVALSQISKVTVRSQRIGISVISFLAAAAILITFRSLPFWITYFVGFFQAAFAISLPVKISAPFVSKLSTLYFPIYLVHVFALDIFSFIFTYIIRKKILFHAIDAFLFSIVIFSISILIHRTICKFLPQYRVLFESVRPQKKVSAV